MRLFDREMNEMEFAKCGPRPDADAAEVMCINAWNQLDSCRQQGFSYPGAIPFPAILAWAEFNRLDHELTVLLLAVIDKLDIDRSDRLASKAKPGSKDAKNAKGKR